MVPDQAARLDEPAKGSFDDPPFRQDLEPFHVVAAFDNLEINASMSFELGYFLHQLAGIASVGPDPLEPAVGGGEARHQQAGSITVLHVGGSHLEGEDEAEGVYQDVSLSSCNLLTRIIATNSGLASCANALAIENRSGRGFFLPTLSRARSRIA